MTKPQPGFGSDPQDNIIPVLPAIIAGMIILVVLILTNLAIQPGLNTATRFFLICYGIAGCSYIGFYYWIYTTLPNRTLYTWINAFVAGGAIGLLVWVTPTEVNYLIHSLVLIASLTSSVVSDRFPSYLLIAIVAGFHIIHHLVIPTAWTTWIIHTTLIIIALIVVETIQQVKTLSEKQMRRLEIVNEISKQMVSTLDTDHLITLLNTALRNALETDTYYIGIRDSDGLKMLLFYDDGEYFNDVNYQLKGSLSGWVISRQRPLFLPDLRKPLDLEGVNMVTVGKPKSSLSWMGVPMTGTHVNGIIAIASYRPNAFNRSDFEMLINIAQRAALALDNTYHHALVEEQARLDSLTRVYNHGYFIKTLQQQAEDCKSKDQPLSLIMLDIDYFKEYNDTYGHLAGDEILVSLCRVIRSHIKHEDAVGRWGGEEFAISLPNTNAEQALIVAQRIRKTLAEFELRNNSHDPIPVPTVSMGIAVFPHERSEISKLIDLADQRLYVAKERGRDQIEAAPA